MKKVERRTCVWFDIDTTYMEEELQIKTVLAASRERTGGRIQRRSCIVKRGEIQSKPLKWGKKKVLSFTAVHS